jgi:phosphoribosylaminoimidazole-succinocarboxamide synthase
MDPIITPTTKGILHIPDVPEEEDTPVSMEFVASHRVDFGLDNILDVWKISRMIQEGANLISRRMAEVGQLFVDTKFEFGYVGLNLIFMDEGGTPDSSRFWSTEEYQNGKIVESSKEGFRQFLLRELDSEILTDPKRMDERKKLAADFDVPITQMMEVSDTYKKLALDITGKEVPVVENPEEEVMDALADLGILN